MFGATGSTSINGYRRCSSFRADIAVLAYVGVALMFVGLGFKVAAAPFHVWTPDVYEGAPSPVVGFMSTAPKAAVFAVLLRIMFEANAPGRVGLIWVVAALSMTLGNIGALVQDNVKRSAGILFDRSSRILTSRLRRSAEQWYSRSDVLHRLLCGHERGRFAVVSHISGEGERYVALEDYEGLGRRCPLAGRDLTIFLFSLIGIPITGGFFAKFYVFSAALQANLVGLVIIGVLNSAVASYYYLRLIVVMYMREAREEVPVAPIPVGLGAALAISLVATIYLGVLPGRLLDYAARAAAEWAR